MTDREDLARRREEATARFTPWRPYLHLGNWGHGLPAFERVRQATWDVQAYRQAHNQRDGDNELAALAVRVTADTLANQIQAAAGPAHDPATVRWVRAGLRCPSQPFCSGCPVCQTVTAPDRLQEGSGRR
jgi:hypothetical protein